MNDLMETCMGFMVDFMAEIPADKTYLETFRLGINAFNEHYQSGMDWVSAIEAFAYWERKHQRGTNEH